MDSDGDPLAPQRKDLTCQRQTLNSVLCAPVIKRSNFNKMLKEIWNEQL